MILPLSLSHLSPCLSPSQYVQKRHPSEKTDGIAHHGLDVQRPGILPVFVEGNQEVDA